MTPVLCYSKWPHSSVSISHLFKKSGIIVIPFAIYLTLKHYTEGGGIKENDGEVNYEIFKNFCNCHNIPTVQWYDN
jgi:hypothetical protein